MRFLPKILPPVALIALSLAGAGYLRATRPAVEPTPEVEQVWTVQATPVDHGDRQPTLHLFGELVAGRDVILRPDVAGNVVEASPELVEGGRFEKGETILKIDPFDYQASIDELLAQIREAEARRTELAANRTMEAATLELERDQLSLIGRDVERYERLSGSRATSEKALDDARIALSKATAAVQQREQAITMLEARLDQQAAAIDRLEVALRRARRDLERTEVKAPFGGLVAEIGAEIGKRLSSGDQIARLIDDRRLEISFQLTDAAFGRLWPSGLIGRPVVGRWRLDAATFDIQAKVARVAPTIDAASGGVTVYAEIIGNADQAPLRPGAFIEVEMADQLYEDVIALPASALFGGDRVYVVENERLRPEVVELVAHQGQEVLIRADLDDGAPVVTSRLAGIEPGLKVKVAE